MECRFCELLHQQQKIIYQDQWISLFFDIDPIAKGHALIIPNQHYLDIDEVPDPVLEQACRCAKAYVGLLKQHLAPAGYSIMQNGGIFNDIGHFHLHVFPRFSAEEFGWTYSDNVDPAASDFETLKGLLQAPLQAKMKINLKP